MSSVTLSIATNTAITIAKGVGYVLTGSPTLFAETIHSLADVGNQVLLKVGEVRSRGGPDREHPFGRGQERFFWALVSAVSVFFVGCGINLYHGIHSLLNPAAGEPFTVLVLGLLLFAFALESWTFMAALKEIGGLEGLKRDRSNTTVLAVLFEDAVALFGIVLTLVVAGAGYLFGPHPAFDAVIAIVVGAMLGGMALFLAQANRKLLIDSSDPALDREAEHWLAAQEIAATVRSLILDSERVVVFVHAAAEVPKSYAIGEALKFRIKERRDKTVVRVYWKFAADA